MALRKYCVIGSPIVHSKSPDIFNRLFEVHDISANYSRLFAQSAEEAVRLVKSLGVEGANVTAPLKQEFLDYVNEVNDAAKTAGAINTVKFTDGYMSGINTDYLGVINSINAKFGDINGKNILILGSGSATRSALLAVTGKNARVQIASRDPFVCGMLAKEFDVDFVSLRQAYNSIKEYDLVISTIPNTTELFNFNEIPKECVVFFADYRNEAPWGLTNYISGENWLIHQALPAFEFWFGFSPDESDVDLIHISGLNNRIYNNISLVGFMGAGKTSVGKALAKKTGRNFIDLDEIIENKANKPISEIFAQYGEQSFRKLETETLSEFLDGEDIRNNNNIIACGGGIVENSENIEILKKIGKTIFLHAEPTVCFDRIKGGDRPLAQDFTNFEALYNQRLDKYFYASDVIFSSEKSIKNVVDNIYFDLFAEKL